MRKASTPVLVAGGSRFDSCSCNRATSQKNMAEWTKEKIKQLIAEDKLYRFYKSREWKELKEKVLKEVHNECLWCREKGLISKAEEVHHIQYVKKYPELALCEYYDYRGQRYRNLVPLCHDCHDRAHERMKYKKKKQVNEERW